MHSTQSLRRLPKVPEKRFLIDGVSKGFSVHLLYVLSRTIIEHFSFCTSRSLLGDRWSDVFRFCTGRYCLELLRNSDLPRCKPFVMVALPTSFLLGHFS